MKKVLMMLFALLALFSSCRKEEQEPQEQKQRSSAKSEFVTLSIQGDLTSAKALSLNPGTNAEGKVILAPAYEGESEVWAHYIIYDADGNSTGLRAVKIKVVNGGKSFLYDSENVDVTGVGSPRYLSVYLGFDKDTHKFVNSAQAPLYNPGQKVTGLNVAFRSERNLLTEETQGGTTKIYNRGIKFSLIGAIYRCKIENNITRPVKVRGIVLGSFGNVGLEVKVPDRSATEPYKKRPWLSCEVNENYVYRLPGSDGITVAAKTGSQPYVYPKEYLVYCPNVHPEDPTGARFGGAIDLDSHLDNDRYNLLTYAGTTLKPHNKNGLRKATLTLEQAALPLKHLVPFFPRNDMSPISFVSFEGIVAAHQFPEDANDFDVNHAPVRPNGSGLSRLYINNRLGVAIGGVTDRFHVEGRDAHPIRGLETRTIFPEEHLNYYRNLGQAEEVIKDPQLAKIGGKLLVVADQYYREKVYDFTPNMQVVENLLGSGQLENKPIYALRYGATQSGWLYVGQYGRSQVNRSNSLRVAYRYSYHMRYLTIESCVVGNDPEIRTAKDLKDKDYFSQHSARVVKVRYPFLGAFTSALLDSKYPLFDFWEYRSNNQRYIDDPGTPLSLREIKRTYPTTRVIGKESVGTEYTGGYQVSYTDIRPYRWTTSNPLDRTPPDFKDYDLFSPITLFYDNVE